jgi:hypothetical protein
MASSRTSGGIIDPEASARVVRKYATGLGLERGYSAHFDARRRHHYSTLKPAPLEDLQKGRPTP